ncbi:HD-GYP domain-containing protein [Pseudoalteromonas fenneropenaei]|uniref:HD-GYP domain-containing protein n=1 Tax=Pseudoalteromonas fenneropenaei TaxID=1737459 RepID=A0ABV7CNP9_9GAMM
MKVINIKELEPGMFVMRVVSQKGQVKVKNQGWVKTAKSIAALAAAGIVEIEIDPSKTLAAEPTNAWRDNAPKPTAPATVATSTATTKRSPSHKSTSIEGEMSVAIELYQEAKQLQQKAFDDIKAGRNIDVSAFQAAASGIIDSIFRNQDALACIARIREKDAYLLEHSLNVSILISIFAKHLELERDVIEVLATGALLHDIGKIQIPDKVLHKAGKLTEPEFQVMQQHAKFSKAILEQSGLPEIAIDIAAYHHERLDGSGYPFQLTGDAISQYVRMASIVDVYDALTAERVYKTGMTPIKAFKILREGCPHHFDESLLSQFIQCIGLYPVGTLVKLKSGRVGVVAQSNSNAPLKPIVKVFYHAKHMHHVQVQDIDLASKKVDDELEAAIKPEEFNIDLIRFFRQSMLP